MSNLLRSAILIAAGAALSGCSLLSSADPYPMYGNPVNPTPAPGYRVRCGTTFLAPPPFGDAVSACRQEFDPVISARG